MMQQSPALSASFAKQYRKVVMRCCYAKHLLEPSLLTVGCNVGAKFVSLSALVCRLHNPVEHTVQPYAHLLVAIRATPGGCIVVFSRIKSFLGFVR